MDLTSAEAFAADLGRIDCPTIPCAGDLDLDDDVDGSDLRVLMRDWGRVDCR